MANVAGVHAWIWYIAEAVLELLIVLPTPTPQFLGLKAYITMPDFIFIFLSLYFYKMAVFI